MILPGKESQTAQMFYAAIPDTVYYNVNQTNIDDESFVLDIKDQIEKILTNSDTTLWTLDSYVLSSKEYSDCKVSYIFKFFEFLQCSINSKFFSNTRLKKYLKEIMESCLLDYLRILLTKFS